MTERVLITGASGFLGFHLIEAALKKGLEVYASVRKSSDIRHLQHFKIKYTCLDFDDISDMKNEIESNKYQYIIHAAGTTKAKSQHEYNKTNANFTYNLGKATELAYTNVKRFVFVSSLAAIGPLQDYDNILTEESTPRPVTFYGKSKLLGEEKLSAMTLPLTIIRPTAIYGPREKDMLQMFKSISKGWEPYIGKRPQQLSFVYVKDAANVIVNALFSNTTQTVYNISDGGFYDRYELANLAKLILKKKTKRVHLSERAVIVLAATLEKAYEVFHLVPLINREKLNELTAANWTCSIEKASHDLELKPAYNLEYGLRETLDWYKTNHWI